MKPRLTLGGHIAKTWRSFIDPPGLDALLDMLDPGVPVEEVPRWHFIVSGMVGGLCALMTAAGLVAVVLHAVDCLASS